MFIEVTSKDDLFREFFIRWDFDTVGAGCRVSIAFIWKMRSQNLQSGIDHLLPRVARTMVSAFEDRARQKLGATIVPW
jgi:ribosome-associated toxin RatA of RatAB toxin-antitoxin module